MRINIKPSIEQWEAEGGAFPLSLDRPGSRSPEPTIGETRAVPHIDHKPPADDDCGMPQHPIYGDYVKDLWRSHTRSGGVPSLIRSRRRVGGRNDCEKLAED